MKIFDKLVGIHRLEKDSPVAIYDRDGHKVKSGDYVAVMVPIIDEYGNRGYHFKGKGRVERIVYLPGSVDKYRAEVQFLAWLSPGWYSGREYCPSAWLVIIEKVPPRG